MEALLFFFIIIMFIIIGTTAASKVLQSLQRDWRVTHTLEGHQWNMLSEG